MAQATQTASMVARTLTRTLGRTVTAKQVRAWGRAHIGRLDDDRYTATAYSAAEVHAITAAFRAAGERRKASTGPAPRRVAPRKGTRAQVSAAAVAESVESAEA